MWGRNLASGSGLGEMRHQLALEFVLRSPGFPFMATQQRALLEALTGALTSARATELPRSALEILVRELDLALGRIWLLDVAGDTLTDALDHHSRIPVADSTAGRVATGNQPLVVEDCLFVPVSQRGQVLGVLELRTPDHEAVIQRASSAASLLAQALIGSRDYGDTLERIRHAHRLSVPATIQHTLLPFSNYRDDAVELAGRLEPAYDVAGDLYDYAVNSEGIHMAIFDAVGHDLRSTTLATLTSGAYRRARRNGSDLDEIASEIDSTVRSFDDGMDFVTGVIARLDPTERLLHIWNSGHLDPLLIRGGRVIPLVPSDRRLPLGLGPLEGTVDIVPVELGDLIVFYTDGVVEARDTGSREWGMANLETALIELVGSRQSLDRIARLVIDQVLGHVGRRLSDDAALMLARLTAPT